MKVLILVCALLTVWSYANAEGDPMLDVYSGQGEVPSYSSVQETAYQTAQTALKNNTVGYCPNCGDGSSLIVPQSETNKAAALRAGAPGTGQNSKESGNQE